MLPKSVNAMSPIMVTTQYFVSSASADLDQIREKSKEHLPSYMHPSRVLNVGSFPLNANGKIDRKALLGQLEAEGSGP